MDQPSAKIVPFDPDARNSDDGDHSPVTPDTVKEKLNDMLTPGYQAEFDPEEAELAGAFFEDALSESDALASAHDFAQTAPRSSPPKS